MDERYIRTRMIMGDIALDRLWNSRVAVFGVGGVGGYVVEALARCGVGHIDIIDDDKVCLSNLNRQIIATEQTLGMHKTDAAEERIRSINPKISVTKHRCFYLPDGRSIKDRDTIAEGDAVAARDIIADGNATKARDTFAERDVDTERDSITEDIDFSVFDYIVDAVDTVTAKIGIIIEAKRLGIPVISVMGCGNRLDPTQLKVADIYETKNDALSKIMRKELRKRGINSLKAVFSTEEAIKPEKTYSGQTENVMRTAAPEEKAIQHTRRSTPGSTVFVPAAAGLIAASVVCRELAGLQGRI